MINLSVKSNTKKLKKKIIIIHHIEIIKTNYKININMIEIIII